MTDSLSLGKKKDNRSIDFTNIRSGIRKEELLKDVDPKLKSVFEQILKEIDTNPDDNMLSRNELQAFFEKVKGLAGEKDAENLSKGEAKKFEYTNDKGEKKQIGKGKGKDALFALLEKLNTLSKDVKITKNEDGSETNEYPDGRTEQVFPDGHKIVTVKNGSKTITSTYDKDDNETNREEVLQDGEGNTIIDSYVNKKRVKLVTDFKDGTKAEITYNAKEKPESQIVYQGKEERHYTYDERFSNNWRPDKTIQKNDSEDITTDIGYAEDGTKKSENLTYVKHGQEEPYKTENKIFNDGQVTQVVTTETGKSDVIRVYDSERNYSDSYTEDGVDVTDDYNSADKKVRQTRIKSGQMYEVNYDEKGYTTGVIVQNGETVKSIADKFNVDPQKLVEANASLLKGKHNFNVGDEIRIPASLNADDPALQGRKTADEARAEEAAEKAAIRARISAENEAWGVKNRKNYGKPVTCYFGQDNLGTRKSCQGTYVGQSSKYEGRWIVKIGSKLYVMSQYDNSILKEDYAKDPETSKAAEQKKAEAAAESKARKEGAALAKEASGNLKGSQWNASGIKKINQMFLNKRINSSNIVAFLEAYNNDKKNLNGDSSLIDAIISETEWGDNSNKKALLGSIINILSAAALKAGVKKETVNKLKQEFIAERDKQLDFFNGTGIAAADAQGMENIINAMLGQIKAAKSGVKADESAGMQDFANENISNTVGNLTDTEKNIASQFYDIVDHNSGSTSMRKLKTLIDKHITKDNVVGVITAYNHAGYKKQDKNIIDSILSESHSNGTPQINHSAKTYVATGEAYDVINALIGKLIEKAKADGIPERFLQEARTEWMQEMYKLKVDDDSKFKEHEIHNNYINRLIDLIGGKDAGAKGAYDDARAAGTWFGDVVDSGLGFFGCKTMTEMEEKLGDKALSAKELMEIANKIKNAKTEAEKVQLQKAFSDKYEDIFGVKYNPQVMAAKESMQNRVAAVAVNRELSPVLANALAASDEAGIKAALNKCKTVMGVGDNKQKIYLTEYVEAQVAAYIEMYKEAGETVNTVDAYKAILTQMKQAYQQEADKALDGSTFEQMQIDLEQLNQAAYGTSNLGKEVAKFNENQTMAETYSELVLDIAATVATCWIPGVGAAAGVKLTATMAKLATKLPTFAKVFNTIGKVGKGITYVSNVAKTTQSGRVLEKVAEGSGKAAKIARGVTTGTSGFARVTNTVLTRSIAGAHNAFMAGGAVTGLHLIEGHNFEDSFEAGKGMAIFAGVATGANLAASAAAQIAAKMGCSLQVAQKSLAFVVEQSIVLGYANYPIVQSYMAENGIESASDMTAEQWWEVITSDESLLNNAMMITMTVVTHVAMAKANKAKSQQPEVKGPKPVEELSTTEMIREYDNIPESFDHLPPAERGAAQERAAKLLTRMTKEGYVQQGQRLETKDIFEKMINSFDDMSKVRAELSNNPEFQRLTPQEQRELIGKINQREAELAAPKPTEVESQPATVTAKRNANGEAVMERMRKVLNDRSAGKLSEKNFNDLREQIEYELSNAKSVAEIEKIQKEVINKLGNRKQFRELHFLAENKKAEILAPSTPKAESEPAPESAPKAENDAPKMEADSNVKEKTKPVSETRVAEETPHAETKGERELRLMNKTTDDYAQMTPEELASEYQQLKEAAEEATPNVRRSDGSYVTKFQKNMDAIKVELDKRGYNLTRTPRKGTDIPEYGVISLQEQLANKTFANDTELQAFMLRYGYKKTVVGDGAKRKIIYHNESGEKFEFVKTADGKLKLNSEAQAGAKPHADSASQTQDVNSPEALARAQKAADDLLQKVKNLQENDFEGVEILNRLTPEERKIFVEALGYDNTNGTFSILASGEKPGAILAGSDEFMSLINKIKGNDFDVVNIRLEGNFSLYFGGNENYINNAIVLNKNMVKNVIAENKEFFARRMGLKDNAGVDEIYAKLIANDGPLKLEGHADLLGMVLGYPKTSTMIFQLEKYINGDALQLRYHKDLTPYKEELIKVLYSENSPYKNMSPEFKADLESKINSMTEIKHAKEVLGGFGQYPFIYFVDEPLEIARIRGNIERTVQKLDGISSSKPHTDAGAPASQAKSYAEMNDEELFAEYYNLRNEVEYSPLSTAEQAARIRKMNEITRLLEEQGFEVRLEKGQPTKVKKGGSAESRQTSNEQHDVRLEDRNPAELTDEELYAALERYKGKTREITPDGEYRLRGNYQARYNELKAEFQKRGLKFDDFLANENAARAAGLGSDYVLKKFGAKIHKAWIEAQEFISRVTSKESYESAKSWIKAKFPKTSEVFTDLMNRLERRWQRVQLMRKSADSYTGSKVFDRKAVNDFVNEPMKKSYNEVADNMAARGFKELDANGNPYPEGTIVGRGNDAYITGTIDFIDTKTGVKYHFEFENGKMIKKSQISANNERMTVYYDSNGKQQVRIDNANDRAAMPFEKSVTEIKSEQYQTGMTLDGDRWYTVNNANEIRDALGVHLELFPKEVQEEIVAALRSGRNYSINMHGKTIEFSIKNNNIQVRGAFIEPARARAYKNAYKNYNPNQQSVNLENGILNQNAQYLLDINNPPKLTLIDGTVVDLNSYPIREMISNLKFGEYLTLGREGMIEVSKNMTISGQHILIARGNDGRFVLKDISRNGRTRVSVNSRASQGAGNAGRAGNNERSNPRGRINETYYEIGNRSEYKQKMADKLNLFSENTQQNIISSLERMGYIRLQKRGVEYIFVKRNGRVQLQEFNIKQKYNFKETKISDTETRTTYETESPDDIWWALDDFESHERTLIANNLKQGRGCKIDTPNAKYYVSMDANGKITVQKKIKVIEPEEPSSANASRANGASKGSRRQNITPAQQKVIDEANESIQAKRSEIKAYEQWILAKQQKMDAASTLTQAKISEYKSILGIPENAALTKDAVKKGLREKSIELHPDKYKGADAEVKMKQVNEANEALNNYLDQSIFKNDIDKYNAEIAKLNKDIADLEESIRKITG